LVPIISNSCNAWVAPQIVDRGQPSYLQTKGRWESEIALNGASFFLLIYAARKEASIDGE
jgi:hypothetical protein